jgi:hypothetical protein
MGTWWRGSGRYGWRCGKEGAEQTLLVRLGQEALEAVLFMRLKWNFAFQRSDHLMCFQPTEVEDMRI